MWKGAKQSLVRSAASHARQTQGIETLRFYYLVEGMLSGCYPPGPRNGLAEAYDGTIQKPSSGRCPTANTQAATVPLIRSTYILHTLNILFTQLYVENQLSHL